MAREGDKCQEGNPPDESNLEQATLARDETFDTPDEPVPGRAESGEEKPAESPKDEPAGPPLVVCTLWNPLLVVCTLRNPLIVKCTLQNVVRVENTLECNVS